MIFEEKTRSIPITQNMVKSAYKKVKSNKGSSGVDGESLLDFQKDLRCMNQGGGIQLFYLQKMTKKITIFLFFTSNFIS